MLENADVSMRTRKFEEGGVTVGEVELLVNHKRLVVIFNNIYITVGKNTISLSLLVEKFIKEKFGLSLAAGMKV